MTTSDYASIPAIRFCKAFFYKGYQSKNFFLIYRNSDPFHFTILNLRKMSSDLYFGITMSYFLENYKQYFQNDLLSCDIAASDKTSTIYALIQLKEEILVGKNTFSFHDSWSMTTFAAECYVCFDVETAKKYIYEKQDNPMYVNYSLIYKDKNSPPIPTKKRVLTERFPALTQKEININKNRAPIDIFVNYE